MPTDTQRRTERRTLRSLPVQLKYAVVVTLVTALVNLASTFIIAWFVQRNYNLVMADELGISTQVVEMVRKEQRLLEWALLILFVASIAISFAVSLFVTRKLTGPIVSLERHLLHLGRGDWSRDFRLRKNDEFRELEVIVNDLKRSRLEKR